MSDFGQQIISWAAKAALMGVAVGSGGLLSQAVVLVFGVAAEPTLIAAFGSLAGTSLLGMFGLAGAVYTNEKE